jgi:hypothetical protein
MVPVNQPSSTDSIAPQSDKSKKDESSSTDKPSSTKESSSTDSIAPQSDKSKKDESSSTEKLSNTAVKKPVEITKVISPTNTNPSSESQPLESEA